MKCGYCAAKKGRRVCKVLDRQEICTACCGVHRSEACAGCSHFGDSERYQHERRLRAGELGFAGRLPEIDAECEEALLWAERDGEVARARARFEALALEHPDYPLVQYGFAACLALEEHHEEAAACFARATEAHPGFAAAYYNWGVSLLRARQLARAAEVFALALQAAAPLSDIARRASARLDELDRMSAEPTVVPGKAT